MANIKSWWQRFRVRNWVHRKSKLDDPAYLIGLGQRRLGYTMDLSHPQTLCEKLNWLKLHDHCPAYPTMVDKAAVKTWAATIIGPEHIIPTLGVWERVDDIDWAQLPAQFVLKCTHDSGSTIIIRDRQRCRRRTIRRQLTRALKYPYATRNREWPYQNVPPRIIAEVYLDLSQENVQEYDVWCFHGRATIVTLCTGALPHRRYHDNFDRDFRRLPWSTNFPTSGQTFTKPAVWDQLLRMAEQLAQGVPFLHVDLYVVRDKIYLGELTFCPWGGFIKFNPPAMDRELGQLLNLKELP